MPVTVQEVNVNTTVQNKGDNGSDSKQAKGKDSAALSKADKEVIIQECLRRVAELLDYQRGR